MGMNTVVWVHSGGGCVGASGCECLGERVYLKTSVRVGVVGDIWTDG